MKFSWILILCFLLLGCLGNDDSEGDGNASPSSSSVEDNLSSTDEYESSDSQSSSSEDDEDCQTKEEIWDDVCGVFSTCDEGLSEGGDVEVVEIGVLTTKLTCTCSDGTVSDQELFEVLNPCSF